MDFSYEATFREESPEAYERLLLDALIGDPTLFIRSDEVEQCWRIIDPIIAHWEDSPGRSRSTRPHRGAGGTSCSPVTAARGQQLHRRSGKRSGHGVRREGEEGECRVTEPIGQRQSSGVSG